MSDTLGWIGVIFSIVCGPIAVWQLIQYFVDRKIRDANKKHLWATKLTLQSIRQMCAEETDVSASTRKWINHIALNLLTVEHHIDAFLESQGEAPEKTKNKKLDKILNDLMISGNEIIQCIKDDTGVPGSPPGSANDPSPRLVETANKWVIDARARVGVMIVGSALCFFASRSHPTALLRF